jgi:NhaP-type Na+/H+ or K+/H+ antiporter
MSEDLLLGLASIIVLGIGAQWLAWRLHLPSILLLLVFGFIAGPVTGFLDPDAIFGDLLLPVVSLSVAIILLEGGLNLRISELRQVGGVVGKLITIGILVTWLIGSAAAYFILDLDFALSVLLGAILVVTGPTVIIPLLRHLRPSGAVGPILKWEGITIDPIGAILAVLVFGAIIAGEPQEATALVTAAEELPDSRLSA